MLKKHPGQKRYYGNYYSDHHKNCHLVFKFVNVLGPTMDQKINLFILI